MSSAVYSSKRLDHLALVAGSCQKIDLAVIIDKVLDTSECRQVNYGHIFTAMLLNIKGFTGRTLHMYSEIFDD
ncbi:MAG: hypothetical protein ACI8R9_001550 [Paraglaciecola sp.]|jgi:hypothetical protein